MSYLFFCLSFKWTAKYKKTTKVMVSGYGCPIFDIQLATIVHNKRYRSLGQVWIIKGVCWGAVWQYMCTLLRKYLSIINSLVITSNSCTRQQTGGSTNKHLTEQSTRISQAVKYLRKCAISVLFLGLKVLARHIYGDSPSFPSDLYMVTAANCVNIELRKKLD